MDKYFKLLEEAKSYNDIKEIILSINKEIDELKKDDNKDKLNELKLGLIQISVVASYIIKKKYEKSLPSIIEDRKKILDKAKSEYTKLFNMLDKLYIVSLGKYEYIDNLPDINRWLTDLFSLYKEYGYNVTMDDFKNIFSIDIADNKRNNIIINKYMESFFKSNGSDEKKFFQLIFSIGEEFNIELDNNLIFDTISMAINIFNSKHIHLLDYELDEINKLASSIGIEKINFDNIYDIRNIVNRKIEELDKRIKEVTDGDYSFLLSDIVNDNDNDELDKDIDIYNICNMITDGKYKDMDINLKEEFFKDLPNIIDIIIKLRIFSYAKDEYINYSIDNEYEMLNDGVIEYEILINELNEKVDILREERKKYLDKKRLFKFSLKKRVNKIDEEILSLEKERIRINLELEELYHKRYLYIKGIYDMYDIELIKSRYNIDIPLNSDKLFGIFDFDMLPLDSDKVNNMEIIKKYGIEIPNINSQEFIIFSNKCLNIYTNDVYKERIKSGSRIKSGVDDIRLDSIINNQYDNIIDTVDMDDIKRRK